MYVVDLVTEITRFRQSRVNRTFYLAPRWKQQVEQTSKNGLHTALGRLGVFDKVPENL